MNTLSGRRTGFLILAALLPLAACDSSRTIEADRQRFPRISASRPLGSVCSENDSASIKRALVHPRWPTGGWSGRPESDPGRTVAVSTSALVWHHGVLKGYVRFAAPGTLRARLYDDVYGSVYGGFSPNPLTLPLSDRPVFVAMDQCGVGDGGLDQVREVCWFPEGSQEGVVVFSSAHAPRESPFRSKDLYRDQDLGHDDVFNDHLAADVLNDTLRDNDLPGARRFVDAALVRLERIPGAVDGSTGQSIPSKVMNAGAWQALLMYKLGLELGRPGFGGTARELEGLAAPEPAKHCYECRWTEAILPLYAWLDRCVRGEPVPAPEPSTLKTAVGGRDPVAIARYLRGEIPEEKFLRQSPVHRFWAGVKRRMAGDTRGARQFFGDFLNGSPAPGSGFELAAALSLIENHSEKK